VSIAHMKENWERSTTNIRIARRLRRRELLGLQELPTALRELRK
jgi:hypothetical protein